eukprot:scaffold145377_cov35-Tisochrysis_lutea.AAC.1
MAMAIYGGGHSSRSPVTTRWSDMTDCALLQSNLRNTPTINTVAATSTHVGVDAIILRDRVSLAASREDGIPKFLSDLVGDVRSGPSLSRRTSQSRIAAAAKCRCRYLLRTSARCSIQSNASVATPFLDARITAAVFSAEVARSQSWCSAEVARPVAPKLSATLSLSRSVWLARHASASTPELLIAKGLSCRKDTTSSERAVLSGLKHEPLNCTSMKSSRSIKSDSDR